MEQQMHAPGAHARKIALAQGSPSTEAPTGELEFFATCPKGFERLLADEIGGLGARRVRALAGQVAFAGALKDAYRVCLWSRLASRVVCVLAHVDALDSDALYASLSEVAWERHLPLDATFAVDAHGSNANLRNTQFVALRAKDAICDRLQARLGSRPYVDARNPDVSVVVRIRGGRATCGIDLSGAPLFYRSANRTPSPASLGTLRADYAAALLAAGGWGKRLSQPSPTLLAAFSGSGTIVAEAAQQALDRAPGLLRSRWGFSRWAQHDEQAWSELLDEADERAERAAARADSLNLIAIDTRPGAVSAARQALRAAGLDVAVADPQDMDELERALSQAGRQASSLLVTMDLSWLAEGSQALEVAALGVAADVAQILPATTPIAALATTTALDHALGLEALDAEDIYLGRDEARLCRYVAGLTQRTPGSGDAAQAPRESITLKDGTRVAVLVKASDQFAARLAKVAKLRAKWARKQGVSCYRVYDADLPDYSVAIDLYQASEASPASERGQRWVVVQEYAAPKEIDPELAHRRLLDVLAIVPPVLGVAPDNVTLRVRRRAKGGSQYADEGMGASGEGRRGWLDLAPGAHLVDEGGLAFEVNLAERLDTGLFLDHRDVRAEVREMAKATKGSKRFLNLFAYTGTASCYAADGGAKHTTTVDLSRTYLEWAERNMARNGFEGERHEFVQADVLAWISEQRRTKNRWDLIFCDPPTFSNSKRMRSAAFDIQRDHAEMLIGISRLLTSDGTCLFSCNLRGFAPDVETLAKYGVEIRDVTEGTIPEDFRRNAKIHHCYLVRRAARA